MKSARPSKAKASAPTTGAAIVRNAAPAVKGPRVFLGTSNPRYLRILAALLTRSRSREEIDGIAGASNGPAAIAELRALGLPKPECLLCERTPTYDKDGERVMRGVYYLTDAGRRRVRAWMRRRDAAKGAP
jgi:hypothetical protein